MIGRKVLDQAAEWFESACMAVVWVGLQGLMRSGVIVPLTVGQEGTESQDDDSQGEMFH